MEFIVHHFITMDFPIFSTIKMVIAKLKMVRNFARGAGDCGDCGDCETLAAPRTERLGVGVR